MPYLMALNSVFPRGYEAFLAGTSGAAFARELGVDSGDAGSYWVLRDGGMDGFRAAMRMTVSLDRKLEAAGRTRAELEEWLEDFLRG
ncbi:MAG: hypothetical protein FJW30_21265 [Acidobacteria bacterium]|nr:hypothetical protein [Acidobacteriota bacterium]